jgi:hypothetical protein
MCSEGQTSIIGRGAVHEDMRWIQLACTRSREQVCWHGNESSYSTKASHAFRFITFLTTINCYVFFPLYLLTYPTVLLISVDMRRNYLSHNENNILHAHLPSSKLFLSIDCSGPRCEWTSINIPKRVEAPCIEQAANYRDKHNPIWRKELRIIF